MVCIVSRIYTYSMLVLFFPFICTLYKMKWNVAVMRPMLARCDCFFCIHPFWIVHLTNEQPSKRRKIQPIGGIVPVATKYLLLMREEKSKKKKYLYKLMLVLNLQRNDLMHDASFFVNDHVHHRNCDVVFQFWIYALDSDVISDTCVFAAFHPWTKFHCYRAHNITL